jgi:hypothetical protein
MPTITFGAPRPIIATSIMQACTSGPSFTPACVQITRFRLAIAWSRSFAKNGFLGMPRSMLSPQGDSIDWFKGTRSFERRVSVKLFEGKRARQDCPVSSRDLVDLTCVREQTPHVTGPTAETYGNIDMAVLGVAPLLTVARTLSPLNASTEYTLPFLITFPQLGSPSRPPSWIVTDFPLTMTRPGRQIATRF